MNGMLASVFFPSFLSILCLSGCAGMGERASESASHFGGGALAAGAGVGVGSVVGIGGAAIATGGAALAGAGLLGGAALVAGGTLYSAATLVDAPLHILADKSFLIGDDESITAEDAPITVPDVEDIPDVEEVPIEPTPPSSSDESDQDSSKKIIQSLKSNIKTYEEITLAYEELTESMINCLGDGIWNKSIIIINNECNKNKFDKTLDSLNKRHELSRS